MSVGPQRGKSYLWQKDLSDQSGQSGANVLSKASAYKLHGLQN